MAIPPPTRVSLRFSRVSPLPPLLLTPSLIPGPLGKATVAAKGLCCLPLVPDCCIRDRLVPTHQPPPTTHQRAPVTSYPPPITIINPSRHSNDVSGAGRAYKCSHSLRSPMVVCCPSKLSLSSPLRPYTPHTRTWPPPTPLTELRRRWGSGLRAQTPSFLGSPLAHLAHSYAFAAPLLVPCALDPNPHPLQPSNDVDGAD